MNHDTMPSAERVIDIRQLELDFFYLPRCKRLRLFETVSKFATEGLSANELLVATHFHRPLVNLGLPWNQERRFSVREIRRIDIDQPGREIGVGRVGSDPQLCRDRPHDFEIAVQEGATIVRLGTAIFGKRIA